MPRRLAGRVLPNRAAKRALRAAARDVGDVAQPSEGGMSQDISKLLTDEQRAALARGEEVEIAIVPGPGKSLSAEQRSGLDLELSPDNARLAESLPDDR